jgi:hypothetical protein
MAYNFLLQRLQGSIPDRGKRFSPRQNVQIVSGPNHALTKWVLGIFQGLKRPRREADRSPPSRTGIKMELAVPLP